MKLELLYGKPEEQGIHEREIADLIETLDREIHHLHGIAVVKDGIVLAEGYWKPYGPDMLHEVHSLAKSINCLAVGIAVEKGTMKLDDCPAKIFGEYLPDEYDKRFFRLTVQDLLTMRAGGAATSTCFTGVESSWITRYFEYPMPADAGTAFRYDTGASYILSAMLTKAEGKTSFEVLREFVLGPLGIKNMRWLLSPEGINAGGFGLFLSLRDLIRLGIFISRKGNVEGKPVYPKHWIDEAGRVRTDTGKPSKHRWESGYGYQFWADEKTFSAFGGYGQFIMQSKSEDLFVACVGGCPNAETERLGDILYDFVTGKTRGADAEVDKKGMLCEALNNLVLPMPKGEPEAAHPSDIFGKRYRLKPNKRQLDGIKMTKTDSDCLSMELEIDGAVVSVQAGYGHYVGYSELTENERWRHIAMAYAWEGDMLLIRNYRTETSYYDDYRILFTKDKAAGEVQVNLSLTGETAETLSGEAEA